MLLCQRLAVQKMSTFFVEFKKVFQQEQQHREASRSKNKTAFLLQGVIYLLKGCFVFFACLAFFKQKGLAIWRGTVPEVYRRTHSQQTFSRALEQQQFEASRSAKARALASERAREHASVRARQPERCALASARSLRATSTIQKSRQVWIPSEAIRALAFTMK